MISVDSSSISSIGYKRRTMLVKFLTGRTYQYKKVPRLVFDDFVKFNVISVLIVWFVNNLI